MCIHVLTAPSFGVGEGDTVPKGPCRGGGQDVHRRGAESRVSRSQTRQQGTAAPVLGVVSPPPDKHSQMQTNSDLGSQIPALLAVLKIAERSACWLQSPSLIRALGWSSRAQHIPPACPHPSILPGPLHPAQTPPARRISAMKPPPAHCPPPLLTPSVPQPGG